MAPFGAYKIHHQLDAVVATTLRSRGCQVAVVACDGIYKQCDVLAWSGKNAANDCAYCAETGARFFKEFDLPVLQMRAFLKEEEFQQARSWAEGLDPADYANARFADLPIGAWVTSSVFSFFRITTKGLDRPDVRAVHKEYLVNGLLTHWAVTRIVGQFRPTHLCVFNARMAPYRIAYEIAKAGGIPIVTHERGVIDDSFILYENQTSIDTRPVFDCAEAWKRVPLTRERCRRAKEYLANRENGKDLNFPAFYAYRTEYAQARQILRIPEGAKVFGVFTSSEFELAYSDSFKAISSQLDIVDSLIEVFRGREEYLVIRHHPYIAGDATSSPDHEFISRAYRQAAEAPPNVRVVMPSEQLSSYALFWNLDGAVAFFSTVGLEAAARGVGTASFSESPFHQALTAVIADPKPGALAELVQRLFDTTREHNLEDLRRVYRFLYTYIGRVPKKFASFGIKNHFEFDLRFKDRRELAAMADPALESVCDHFLRGAPILPVPTSGDLAASTAEEEEFLQNELSALREQRAKVRAETAALSPNVTPVAVLRSGRSANFRNSRHAPLAYYELPSPTLRDCVATLGQVREEWVVVEFSPAFYDESFVSGALNKLEGTELQGALYGAWLTDGRGGIFGEIFTKRVSAADFGEAAKLLPCLRDPMCPLGFGVFRTAALRGICHAALALSEPEAQAKKLFESLAGPELLKTNLPMLTLPHA